MSLGYAKRKILPVCISSQSNYSLLGLWVCVKTGFTSSSKNKCSWLLHVFFLVKITAFLCKVSTSLNNRASYLSSSDPSSSSRCCACWSFCSINHRKGTKKWLVMCYYHIVFFIAFSVLKACDSNRIKKQKQTRWIQTFIILGIEKENRPLCVNFSKINLLVTKAITIAWLKKQQIFLFLFYRREYFWEIKEKKNLSYEENDYHVDRSYYYQILIRDSANLI